MYDSAAVGEGLGLVELLVCSGSYQRCGLFAGALRADHIDQGDRPARSLAIPQGNTGRVFKFIRFGGCIWRWCYTQLRAREETLRSHVESSVYAPPIIHPIGAFTNKDDLD